jgi:hemin uptake protein HemP
MSHSIRRETQVGQAPLSSITKSVASAVTRIKSQDLFNQMRELEIDHGGRIYKLRLTQLNKLILTA